MFRTSVWSIVLTLTLGPTASLLCVALCHPAGLPTAVCAHENATSHPSVTMADNCPDLGAESAAFVREDVRAEAFTPQTHAIVVLAFQFAAEPGHSTRARGAGQQPPPETQPLVLALRI